MTTRPPTSNPPELPEAVVPAGLPDVASLAQLANAFFASLPGSAPSGGAPFGNGLSDSVLPGGVSALAGVSPVEPFPSGAAASFGAAERHAGEKLPAGIADGLDLGSPEAYAAALPTLFPAAGGLAPSAGGAPSTPYYFLGEGSAYSGEPERFADIPVEPDSLAVPGGDALGKVLRSILAEPSAPAASAGPGPDSSISSNGAVRAWRRRPILSSSRRSAAVSTCRRCAGTSRFSPNGSTASHWCGSTTPPPRRSPRR
ncbi:hypothetical protein ACFSVK_07335 [Azorhizophilus paspali]|uniref:hypothetical protein n=1 Tax=Azorhizophilus paspali TaxID=69963 RepID=UPI003639FB4A